MEERTTCDVCRYDSRGYTAHDAERTLASLPIRWTWMTEGLSDVHLAARPAPGMPSAAELGALALAATDVHGATHHLQEAGRAIHAVGAGAPSAQGRLHRISTSGGGVPKLGVDAAHIGWRGLSGDRQAARRHHGRVWQAVSLWSIEVIDGLRAEGHPIGPGLAGENLTVSGLDWSRLRPGTRIAAGTALLEVSAYATPCTKNAQWFLKGDFHRMNHDRQAGVSRLYAMVVADGDVHTGDTVTVEPSLLEREGGDDLEAGGPPGRA